MGVDLLIFQAVHDARWGAYYPSQLPFAAPWNGSCADVVGAVLAGADAVGSRVLLSCEFVHDESDSVTDPSVMAGRLAIMEELATGWVPQHPSFLGWYFSSEAYIAPYFQNSVGHLHRALLSSILQHATMHSMVPLPLQFIAYISTLSARARQLTPAALLFSSPYGTRSAINDDKFVAQLRSLDLDVLAYQDEVGCVRDEVRV